MTLSQETFCPNQNHKRSNAPVRHCPQCGGVVNDGVPAQTCPDARHDEQRRRQSLFCIDCGRQLRVAS